MNKKNIIVLFGGQSSEHEISCISAKTIMENIDLDKYNIYPVGITKEGNWRLYEGVIKDIADDKWVKDSVNAIISPDATDKSLLVFKDKNVEKINIDIVFPALHGLYGEDGSVQGLLELAGIPYVGCGILASSVSMDKLFTKIIVDTLGIRQARYKAVHKKDMDEIKIVVDKIEKEFDYPIFIKPSNAGSSKGITKAHNRGELFDGLELGIKHDSKLLIEETIVGRELECAVLGNYHPKTTNIGEIISAGEFYDYDAKYNDEGSKTIINPELPKDIVKQIKNNAEDIFKAVDGRGLARADFFLEEKTGEVVFNEINTLPGFTGISMYPMLWEDKGMPIKQLIDKLINFALNK
ncbi:MAG: D-alanine--D-alanine ligase [Vallitalea sp.]|jgi:D-alanine-D-alanine ligase|nr:D-alanine--D-alanine ligase [Vallitalea sp.]